MCLVATLIAAVSPKSEWAVAARFPIGFASGALRRLLRSPSPSQPPPGRSSCQLCGVLSPTLPPPPPPPRRRRPPAALLAVVPLRARIVRHFHENWAAAITSWTGLAIAWVLLAVPTVVLTIIFGIYK